MVDPLQVIAAAALLAVYYMFEYWPATLGLVFLIVIVVISNRSSKPR
jgi:hypothetical protein